MKTIKFGAAFLAMMILAFAALPFVCLWIGCATDKQVTSTSTTNQSGSVTVKFTTNTVVDPAGLLIDTAIAQSVSAVAVSAAVQKDPSIIPVLKDVETALSGVINGANTNTTSQILATLGKNTNPTIAVEIDPLVGTISGLEQNLIAKYGAGVGGQVTIAIAKAVLSGFTVGLAGK